MAIHIQKPTIIDAAGTGGKIIRELVGLVNSDTGETSIARMSSPQGWREPGQRPEFNEYTLVLEGRLQVETDGKTYTIGPNELFIAEKSEYVRYSTPHEGGAEYIAVCIPAFSPNAVHRAE